MARPSRTLRALEDGLQPLRELGRTRRLGKGVQSAAVGGGRDRLDHGRLRHPRASGFIRRKRGIQRNALGRSRGGFSTNLHAITDTKGNPLHVAITPGQQHDATMAEVLLEHARGRAVLADKGYDADRIIMAVVERGMQPVIGSKRCRTRHYYDMDDELYLERYQIECFLHRPRRESDMDKGCRSTPFRRPTSASLALGHYGSGGSRPRSPVVGPASALTGRLAPASRRQRFGGTTGERGLLPQRQFGTRFRRARRAGMRDAP